MAEEYQQGDYNRSGMLAFTFSIVFTLAFFVYVSFMHKGVDLKEITEPAQKVEQQQEQPEQPEASAE